MLLMVDQPHSPADKNGASAGPARDNGPTTDSVSREDFAVFAHELRGALTVIAGYSDMLRRPLHDDERFAALEGIRRAVGRADVLCSEVLSGRAAGARPTPTREHVQLWALAQHVADEQHAASGRTIVVEAPGDAAVTGDEQALARLLTNLVSNAVKYSPAETVVRVRVGGEYTPQLGATAVIEVSDRGPGIPLGERERLFEPFERLGRDESTPGTGLGLAIVAGVVRDHGGNVRILDHSGGGTTVRVELPVAN